MDRARGRRSGSAGQSTPVATDHLIQIQITAAGLACQRMTQPSLKALHDAVAEAVSLPAKPQWTKKAAAHSKILRLLVDMSSDRPSEAAITSNRFIRDVIRASGPAADGVLTRSHGQLLQHLARSDAASAELEVERLLRVLHWMWRLATAGRGNYAVQGTTFTR